MATHYADVALYGTQAHCILCPELFLQIPGYLRNQFLEAPFSPAALAETLIEHPVTKRGMFVCGHGWVFIEEDHNGKFKGYAERAIRASGTQSNLIQNSGEACL